MEETVINKHLVQPLMHWLDCREGWILYVIGPFVVLAFVMLMGLAFCEAFIRLIWGKE